jgi:high-affinity iron transporter
MSDYGTIETLAPKTTVPLDVVLGPGTYYWKCTNSFGSVNLSSAGTVHGKKVNGTKANLPVTYAELVTATTAYRSQIEKGLGVLAVDTDALTSAVASGDRTRSEQLWLVAHLDYASLGAAYGTFGDFDEEINGRPNGLPEGVNDPKFHGFLRLEYGLWNGQPNAELVPVADRLDVDVHKLVNAFPSEPTPPTDVPLRTHEILENTLQFELTGETDQGSHTNLATAAANVAGTETTLGAIAPLLEERNPSLLSTLQSGLTQFAAELQKYDLGNGSWVPLQALSQAQHEQLDGTLSNLLENLSLVPDILEISPNAADKT